jgi:hypothetical protein
MTNLEKFIEKQNKYMCVNNNEKRIQHLFISLAIALNEDLKLINKPVETTNEQPKLSNKIKEIENSLDYDDCVNPTIAKINDKINTIVKYLG